MLYTPLTRLVQAPRRDLHPEAILTDEGVALVAAPGGTVKVASGLDGEVFAGVAMFQRGHLTKLPKNEAIKALTANFETVLASKPIGGVVTVRNSVTNAKLAETTDYTFDIASNTLTLVKVGVEVSVWYEYSPTLIEARVVQGDVQPGGVVPMNYDWVACLSRGDVYTSHFEVADDWTAPNLKIRLGANGKFTTQGTGTAIDGYVVGVPTGEIPFLGICLK